MYVCMLVYEGYNINLFKKKNKKIRQNLLQDLDVTKSI